MDRTSNRTNVVILRTTDDSPMPNLPSTSNWGRSSGDAAPITPTTSLPSSSIHERPSRAINGNETSSAPSSSSTAREFDNAHVDAPKIFNVNVSHSHLDERSKIQLLTVKLALETFRAEKLAEELAHHRASSAPPADKILTGTKIPVAPSKKSRRRRRHRRGRRGRPPRQGRNLYHRTTTTQSTHTCPSSTSIPSQRDDMKKIASSFAPSPTRRRRRRRYRSRYRKTIAPSRCLTDVKVVCHLPDTNPNLTYNNRFESAVLDCGGEVAFTQPSATKLLKEPSSTPPPNLSLKCAELWDALLEEDAKEETARRERRDVLYEELRRDREGLYKKFQDLRRSYGYK